MSNSVAKAGVVILLSAHAASAAFAAPGDRIPAAGTAPAISKTATRPVPQTRPSTPVGAASGTATTSRPVPSADRPVSTSYQQRTTNPASKTYTAKTQAAPATTKTNTNYNNSRPNGSNNTVVAGNTVVVAGGNRPPNRYPVYQTPSGGYYRPPNGGYYRPPPPPVGGWGGGYYPPPRYYYDDGPSVGEVIAGVAVTGTLLYVLSEATKPKQQTVVVQGAPPPMPPPPQPYVPPKNSTGAPAKISVDFAGLAPEARPSASVCIAEASRQIGATGGSEIRIDRIVDVEPGNGGYRFRVNLLGVYPDETRMIPMYCRATPEKIVELTFG